MTRRDQKSLMFEDVVGTQNVEKTENSNSIIDGVTKPPLAEDKVEEHADGKKNKKEISHYICEGSCSFW